MRSWFLIPLAVAIVSLTGCDKNSLGTIDPRGNAPAVSSFSVSPAAVRIDTLTPSNGLYPVAITMSAHVSDPDGAADIASVTVAALSPDGETAATALLHDDGVAPDAAANDGIFSGSLQLGLAKSDVGTYRLVFSATDKAGLAGTSMLRDFVVSRHSSPPWLFALNAPDTLVLPASSGSFTMSVSVGDSDGLGDIQSVFLRIPEGTNPNLRLPLYDDGDLATHGDSVAGDGRYSIGLTINRPASPKLYTLQFQAIDRAGDSSATLSHPLIVR